MNKRIILIGGMPTAGKSTVAHAVAKHFNLPWISTDQICVIMQSIASKDQYPKLFYPEYESIEKFIENHSPEFIMNLEYEQDREIWRGAQAFISKQHTWRNGFVMEGVAVLPSVVNEAYRDDPRVSTVFLTDGNHERTRKVIFDRGLATAADRYSDHVKDKELEWVKLFDQRIRDEANEFGYPVLEVDKNESDLDKILLVLD